jgi:hypothetical protein
MWSICADAEPGKQPVVKGRAAWWTWLVGYGDWYWSPGARVSGLSLLNAHAEQTCWNLFRVCGPWINSRILKNIESMLFTHQDRYTSYTSFHWCIKIGCFRWCISIGYLTTLHDSRFKHGSAYSTIPYSRTLYNCNIPICNIPIDLP